MKKPHFLPFWAVGISIFILYVIGICVTLTLGKTVPALPHAAELGEASALVGSFLTVISTFFLLYTIYLQQRIRDEQAVEAHWFELLKRWPEYAQDRELKDRAADYQHELVKVELSFRIPDSANHLSEQEGFEIITYTLSFGGMFQPPAISESLDRLFAAMMTLRERISDSGRDLLDNSLLPFIPPHITEALVYSALRRADSASLLRLTHLGLAERALRYAPETRWFLTRHYGSAQQKKEKAQARQQEENARAKALENTPANAGQDQA